jgi:hypothetical protein
MNILRSNAVMMGRRLYGTLENAKKCEECGETSDDVKKRESPHGGESLVLCDECNKEWQELERKEKQEK